MIKLREKLAKKSAENKFSYYGQNASIKINKFKVIEESKIKSVKPVGYDDLFNAIDIILESSSENEKP